MQPPTENPKSSANTLLFTEGIAIQQHKSYLFCSLQRLYNSCTLCTEAAQPSTNSRRCFMLNDPTESSKNYGFHTSFTMNSKVEMAVRRTTSSTAEPVWFLSRLKKKKKSPRCPQWAWTWPPSTPNNPRCLQWAQEYPTTPGAQASTEDTLRAKMLYICPLYYRQAAVLWTLGEATYGRTVNLGKNDSEYREAFPHGPLFLNSWG